MRQIGYKNLTGGSHTHLSRKIRRLGLDTSHFMGSVGALRRFKHTGKKLPVEILVFKDGGRREVAYRLRRALIESGIEYVCYECGIGPEWNSKDLVLEVDHKNNKCTDNRIENLRFLCPNCHSQRKHKMNKGLTTVTQFKPVLTKRKRVTIVKLCVACKDKISRRNRSGLCKSCVLHKTKIDWPSLEVLVEAKRSRKVQPLAKSLGISDVAIHKRIKRQLSLMSYGEVVESGLIQQP